MGSPNSAIAATPIILATGSPVETSIAIIGANKPDSNEFQGFFKLFNLASKV
jgi:hypothetical protein